MGPLEFLVLELPGEALSAARTKPPAERRRTARTAVLDSLVVTREPDGRIVTAELSDTADVREAASARTPAHVIGAADVNRVAARLAPGRTALLLLAEQGPATAPKPTSFTLADQLARLGDMLREGSLSPEEFEAAKAELLG
jgi:hypothetical protein